jgi:hypothetical protein
VIGAVAFTGGTQDKDEEEEEWVEVVVDDDEGVLMGIVVSKAKGDNWYVGVPLRESVSLVLVPSRVPGSRKVDVAATDATEDKKALKVMLDIFFTFRVLTDGNEFRPDDFARKGLKDKDEGVHVFRCCFC